MTRWQRPFLAVLSWPTTSQTRAVENARVATTECSRRRVEREEVALFLEQYDVRRAEAARFEQQVASSG